MSNSFLTQVESSIHYYFLVSSFPFHASLKLGSLLCNLYTGVSCKPDTDTGFLCYASLILGFHGFPCYASLILGFPVMQAWYWAAWSCPQSRISPATLWEPAPSRRLAAGICPAASGLSHDSNLFQWRPTLGVYLPIPIPGNRIVFYNIKISSAVEIPLRSPHRSRSSRSVAHLAILPRGVSTRTATACKA